MRKLLHILVIFVYVGLLFLGVSTMSLAQNEVPPVEKPVLTTSAGQSADISTLNILMDEAGILYDYCDVPSVEMLSAGVGLGGVESGPGFHVEVHTDLTEYPTGTPYKSMIFAIGASSKGMGASGLTIDDELSRLKKLVDYAKKNEIFIIAVHVGGLSTRGNPGSDNEKVIDAIAPHSNLIVVTKDGNKDDRFSKIAETNNILLVAVDYALDVVEVFQDAFSGELTEAKCE